MAAAVARGLGLGLSANLFGEKSFIFLSISFVAVTLIVLLNLFQRQLNNS